MTRFPRLCRGAALAAGLTAAASPAPAHYVEDFVASNMIAVFYHELGHALIDVMRLPIFGQEEDAADVLSILMIDEIFEEDSAAEIARDAAMGFLADTDSDIAWWDVHGADLQRFYTLVCLFYGASPDTRADIAAEFDLPDARADGCPEEYALAIDSWGPVLDEIHDATEGHRLRLLDRTGPEDRWATLTRDVVRAEVDALNDAVLLDAPVDVLVTACGEMNAFYDPSERTIIMCTELAEHFATLFAR